MCVASLALSSGKSPQVKAANTGGWLRLKHVEKPRSTEQGTDNLCCFKFYKTRARETAGRIKPLPQQPDDLSWTPQRFPLTSAVACMHHTPHVCTHHTHRIIQVLDVLCGALKEIFPLNNPSTVLPLPTPLSNTPARVLATTII